MSRSHRLYQRAARGFLAGAVLCAVWSLGLASEHEGESPHAQATNESDASVEARAAPAAAQQAPSPKQDKGICDEPQSAEEADLCQQWRMAEAAEQQAKWTERQFWITAAEVTGLVLIVAFTAWTGRAAARSARAAEEAVRVASTTAKHQLRAYLFAEDANRVLNGETVALKKWQVHASIKNYGQTPAHNVVISTQVEVVGPDGDLDWNDLAVRQPIYMAPNEVVTAELDIDFSGRKFQQFTGGQSTVYFWGEISYLDVFGAVHHARFRMENAYRAGVNFAYCSEGNGST